MNISVPAAFSYGISFYTVIPINTKEYLICLLHKEGDSPTTFWITQTDEDRGPAINELQSVRFNKSLLQMLARSFKDGKDNDIIVKVGKSVFELTYDLLDDDSYKIYQLGKSVRIPAASEDLFCSVLESALDYIEKDELTTLTKKVMDTVL
jgi:hypothetical protein